MPFDLKSRERNDAPGKAQYIEKNSPQLNVLAFDLNSIKLETDFKEPKLLVYNDSFHDGWRASVNGRRVPVLRANFAFKGVWLEGGKNIVIFRFGAPWRYFLNYFLLVFYAVFLFCLMREFIRDRKIKIREGAKA